MPTTNVSFGRDLSALGLVPDTPANRPVKQTLDSGGDPRLREALQEAGELEQRIQALQEPTAGPLKRLISNPAGIASLLGTLGLTAVGGPVAGLSFGTGALQGVGQAQAQDEAQRMDMLDRMEERLEKLQQRVIQVFQANPNAFLTESGESAVPPHELGRIMLGIPLPINPAAAHAISKKNEAQIARTNFILDQYKNATTKRERSLHLRRLNHVLDLGYSNTDLDTMGERTLNYIDFIRSDNLDQGSVLSAIAYAEGPEGNGIDGTFLGMLSPAVTAGGLSATWQQAKVDSLLRQMKEWRQAHPDIDYGNNYFQLAQDALPPEDAAWIGSRVKLFDGSDYEITPQDYIAAVDNIEKHIINIETVTGKAYWPMVGIDPNDTNAQQSFIQDLAMRGFTIGDRMAQERGARGVVGQMRKIANDLQEQGASRAEANAAAAAILKIAYQKAGGNIGQRSSVAAADLPKYIPEATQEYVAQLRSSQVEE